MDRLNTPWTHVGLTRAEYMARQPWKLLGMKRRDFEQMILARDPSDFTEMKRSAEADRLCAEIFGG